MISIVLVHIIAHLSTCHNFHDALIDDLQHTFIFRWSEQLQDFQNFDLQPWARSAVVQIVSCVVMNALQYADQLGHYAFEALTTFDQHSTMYKRAR